MRNEPRRCENPPSVRLRFAKELLPEVGIRRGEGRGIEVPTDSIDYFVMEGPSGLQVPLGIPNGRAYLTAMARDGRFAWADNSQDLDVSGRDGWCGGIHRSRSEPRSTPAADSLAMSMGHQGSDTLGAMLPACRMSRSVDLDRRAFFEGRNRGTRSEGRFYVSNSGGEDGAASHASVAGSKGVAFRREGTS